MKYDVKQLHSIVTGYWKDFMDKVTDDSLFDYIVGPSIPIVWFGDLDAYFASPIRTITIGINPSLSEFWDGYHFDIGYRFPKAETIIDHYDVSALIVALNDYFKYYPYSKWFNCFDEKCMGFARCGSGGYDVGYNQCGDPKKHANTALHIDFETAIATDPTWGKLDAVTKWKLQSPELFDELYDFLDPNVVFISMKKAALHAFGNAMGYNLFKPLCVSLTEKMECHLCNGKLIFFGRSNGQPFAPIADVEKEEFFTRVFDKVRFDNLTGKWIGN